MQHEDEMQQEWEYEFATFRYQKPRTGGAFTRDWYLESASNDERSTGQSVGVYASRLAEQGWELFTTTVYSAAIIQSKMVLVFRHRVHDK